jgi:hypothetical protein
MRPETPMRHFTYIDERLMKMYFTQLPHSTRQKLHDARTTTYAEFEASISPKVKSSKSPLLAPSDDAVAMIPFLESYLLKGGHCGPIEDRSSTFVDDVFDGFATRLQYLGNDSGRHVLFIVVPAEPHQARFDRHCASYIIIGSAANCWNARGPVGAFEVDSPLERLLTIAQQIPKFYATDFVQAFSDSGPHLPKGLFEDGDPEDTFFKLSLIQSQLQQAGTPASLRGICRVRYRLGDDSGRISVLYPLFLEDASTQVR